MIEIPFIPGILILLIIFIAIAIVYGVIANYIGEQIRKLLIVLWEKVKKKYNQYKL